MINENAYRTLDETFRGRVINGWRFGGTQRSGSMDWYKGPEGAFGRFEVSVNANWDGEEGIAAQIMNSDGNVVVSFVAPCDPNVTEEAYLLVLLPLLTLADNLETLGA